MHDDQLLRYSRQILLKQIDVAGQQALLQARVLIVGLGGLGSPAALYLAAAGIGTLLLADPDEVDLTNLQRQIIHQTGNIGHSKVDSASQSIAALNPQTELVPLPFALADEQLDEAVASVDVILDCSDNFATRQAVNRACFAARKPLVSGAAIRLEGQLSVFDPRLDSSPCYQCLYGTGDETTLSCSEAGVLGPLVGMVGSLQALETIKLIVGFGEPLIGRLLLIDALDSRFREMRLRRDPACAVCAGRTSDA